MVKLKHVLLYENIAKHVYIFVGIFAANVLSTIVMSCYYLTTCLVINYKFIKLQPFIRFVDVLATTAAFVRMTVHHQVSTLQTGSYTA